MSKPRILIPEPTSHDAEYNQRSWQQYADAVEQAGGIPVAVPLHAGQEEQARIVAGAQGVLLPGSPADVNPEKWNEPLHPKSAPADPLRDAADELLLQDAFNLQKPIFGICYGMQSMNVWRGGSLIQHLETPVNHTPGRQIAEAHTIAVTPGTLLAELVETAQSGISPVLVNSSHHQAVARIGDQLHAVAISPLDGTVEAIEGLPGNRFVLGVQWHPERTRDSSPLSRELFRAFVEAAAEWKPQPNGAEIAEASEKR
ncbi:MAG TPA: gamma-glutamyl-gamma-aminobutyrate hydrolase family protein [Acidobacteriaceae bacterium]|jgi:putative glutamine amidotransferase